MSRKFRLGSSFSRAGIRRPSAPYRLAAHDWTCDRAIIAFEHDLSSSSADFFLFFLE
jgi:hypothetical protein